MFLVRTSSGEAAFYRVTLNTAPCPSGAHGARESACRRRSDAEMDLRGPRRRYAGRRGNPSPHRHEHDLGILGRRFVGVHGDQAGAVRADVHARRGRLARRRRRRPLVRREGVGLVHRRRQSFRRVVGRRAGDAGAAAGRRARGSRPGNDRLGHPDRRRAHHGRIGVDSDDPGQLPRPALRVRQLHDRQPRDAAVRHRHSRIGSSRARSDLCHRWRARLRRARRLLQRVGGGPARHRVPREPA